MIKRLSSRHYALIGGQAISIFGDNVARTVLMLYVLDKTGSAFNVGIMLIMNSLPSIIGVSSGYFSRRYPLKNLLITYSLLSAILSLSMIVFTGISTNLLGIYIMYFLLALMNALYIPTRLALLSRIVPTEGLKSFNSLDQTMEALMMASGIAVSGYMYSLLGINMVFIVNSISFIFVAVIIIISMSNKKADLDIEMTKDSSGESIFRILKEISYNKELLFFTFGVGLSGIAVGIFGTMYVVFIRKDLGQSALVYSEITSIRALTSSVLGFVLAFSWIKIREKTMVVGGYLAMGAGIIAMTVFLDIRMMIILNGIIGVANMLYYVAVRTLLQKVGKDFTAELFSLQAAIMRFGMVLAMGLSGILSDKFALKSKWELWISGIIFILIGIWGQISIKMLPENKMNKI